MFGGKLIHKLNGKKVRLLVENKYGISIIEAN
jgi:hypothetical protein